MEPINSKSRNIVPPKTRNKSIDLNIKKIRNKNIANLDLKKLKSRKSSMLRSKTKNSPQKQNEKNEKIKTISKEIIQCKNINKKKDFKIQENSEELTTPQSSKFKQKIINKIDKNNSNLNRLVIISYLTEEIEKWRVIDLKNSYKEDNLNINVNDNKKTEENHLSESIEETLTESESENVTARKIKDLKNVEPQKPNSDSSFISPRTMGRKNGGLLPKATALTNQDLQNLQKVFEQERDRKTRNEDLTDYRVVKTGDGLYDYIFLDLEDYEEDIEELWMGFKDKVFFILMLAFKNNGR